MLLLYNVTLKKIAKKTQKDLRHLKLITIIVINSYNSELLIQDMQIKFGKILMNL